MDTRIDQRREDLGGERRAEGAAASLAMFADAAIESPRFHRGA
jgi:hypothetical protein